MTAPAYPLLWYSSNSPHKDGTTTCDMARYLGYHAGSHGTGWRLKSQNIPLATGAGLHKGLQNVADWIMEYQANHPNRRLLELPIEVAAWAATDAAESYRARATARGLLLTENDSTVREAVETLIAEQATLIEGMVHVWCLVHLPALLSEYVLVAAEREDGLIFDCTCGLGDAIVDEGLHVARNCAGILYQTKCDQLWRHATRSTHLYPEFKGWGTINAGKEKKWEHDGQLLFNLEAASKKFGVPVDEAIVAVLLKGYRGRDQGDPPEAPKYQHSPLCYGYFRGGAPPFNTAEWKAKAKWRDEFGKGHTLPFTGPNRFQKVPIWNEAIPMEPIREGASRVETWVRRHIEPIQYADLIRVLGPFPRNQVRLPLAVKGILAEERRFRSDVELLRTHGAVLPDHPMIDDVIVRTWECTNYDGTPCSFKRICFREPGWENPEGSGWYERRRPHHAPELAAVEALGIDLPADEWADEGEDPQ